MNTGHRGMGGVQLGEEAVSDAERWLETAAARASVRGQFMRGDAEGPAAAAAPGHPRPRSLQPVALRVAEEPGANLALERVERPIQVVAVDPAAPNRVRS